MAEKRDYPEESITKLRQVEALQEQARHALTIELNLSVGPDHRICGFCTDICADALPYRQLRSPRIDGIPCMETKA